MSALGLVQRYKWGRCGTPSRSSGSRERKKPSSAAQGSTGVQVRQEDRMGRWGCLRQLLRGGVSRGEGWELAHPGNGWREEGQGTERPPLRTWEQAAPLYAPQCGGVSHPSWRSQHGHGSLWTTPDRQEVAIWFGHSCFHNHIMSSWPLQSDLFFLSWHVVFSFLFSSRNFLFLFIFSAMRHVRSYFLNRGARVRTLQWKHAVLPPDHQGSPSQILLYCSHIKYQPISPYLIWFFLITWNLKKTINILNNMGK